MTFRAPRLLLLISGGGTPLPQVRLWGSRSCQNTKPYRNPPHTGITRSYDLHISKKIISPDGVNRSAIVVNGAFPGPTIEANSGDWIQVIVHNDMDNEVLRSTVMAFCRKRPHGLTACLQCKNVLSLQAQGLPTGSVLTSTARLGIPLTTALSTLAVFLGQWSSTAHTTTRSTMLTSGLC